MKARGFLSNKGTDNFSGCIITVNGKLTAAQHRAIADAAEKYGNGEITFTSRMTVEIPGIPYEKIDEFCEFIGQAGLVTGGTGAKVRPVVSCKGTTCQYGLLDSFALSEEIHKRFYEGYHQVGLPHKFIIAVGGCPNNCVKPDLMGIVGQRIPSYDSNTCKGCNNCVRCIGKCPFKCNAQGTYGYKIYIGGRWGKKVSRGIPLSKIFTDREETLHVVEKAILLFREQGQPGERFAATIERLGFANVEAMLISDELLERKQEII